ncbi:uncharacterized protein LOC105923251 [Fundulus heteroclitus]|uniref:uncharacterized protein LOC105923251 n=1 Tax=Fundulus heteroclitus TaxID=8078 RepID=UPI00165B9FB3|nr:uncharacterized protein LOC105923251 [Fundulus heteroclitus]
MGKEMTSPDLLGSSDPEITVVYVFKPELYNIYELFNTAVSIYITGNIPSWKGFWCCDKKRANGQYTNVSTQDSETKTNNYEPNGGWPIDTVQNVNENESNKDGDDKQTQQPLPGVTNTNIIAEVEGEASPRVNEEKDASEKPKDPDCDPSIVSAEVSIEPDQDGDEGKTWFLANDKVPSSLTEGEASPRDKEEKDYSETKTNIYGPSGKWSTDTVQNVNENEKKLLHDASKKSDLEAKTSNDQEPNGRRSTETVQTVKENEGEAPPRDTEEKDEGEASPRDKEEKDYSETKTNIYGPSGKWSTDTVQNVNENEKKLLHDASKKSDLEAKTSNDQEPNGRRSTETVQTVKENEGEAPPRDTEEKDASEKPKDPDCDPSIVSAEVSIEPDQDGDEGKTWFLANDKVPSGPTADPIYKKVGDSVVLNPGQVLDPISSVTWKQEPDLALEWDGPSVICYRDFKDRCSLNKKDGSFTISNLTVEDSGIYTPQINNKVLKKLELQVIEPVPKPTVSVKCNNEKTRCNLTCEANVSPDVGTVTYRWRNGEMVLSNDKELIITTEDKESSFICELENIVSSSSSDGVDNPLSRGNYLAKTVIVLLIGAAAVVLILVGCVVCCMRKKGKFPTWKEFWCCGNNKPKGTSISESATEPEQFYLYNETPTIVPTEGDFSSREKYEMSTSESATEPEQFYLYNETPTIVPTEN